MLLEHLVPKRMDGGNMVEKKTMTEEDSRQTTLEEFGFEFH